VTELVDLMKQKERVNRKLNAINQRILSYSQSKHRQNAASLLTFKREYELQLKEINRKLYQLTGINPE